MAGHIETMSDGSKVAIDYADAWCEGKVKGITYRWEFAWWGGPTFLKKNGDPLKRQPVPRYPGRQRGAWLAFERWFAKWSKSPEGIRSRKNFGL